MKRREFLRAGAVLGGLASLTSEALAAKAAPPQSGTANATGQVQSRFVPGGSIRDYLARQAQGITNHALQDFRTAADWRRLIPGKRRQFLEMMGLDEWWTEHRDPPRFTVTGVVRRERYRIEKLHYESLPNLYVTANLYIPNEAVGRRPGVLYVCGHAREQKFHYQAHPRRFAELGFVCLIAETVQLGEVEGYHHGCYREGWWHWYSRGYTPAGIECLNGIRGLDLLAARADVDPQRLGVTGISGGGAASWWIAAADERVKVSAPVCGTATLYSHVHDRTIDGHCDCMWWNNHHQWDMADVGALIAPRPLLIASADRDGIFTIESIRQVRTQLAGLYRRLKAEPDLQLVATPGGHSYHANSRTAIFAWFLRHLAGTGLDEKLLQQPIGQLDIDDRPEKQESVETLRVYEQGSPPGNRAPTIQDNFFTPLSPPVIHDRDALVRERKRVVERLRQTSFAAFPDKPAALDLQVEQEFIEDHPGFRFGFTPEEGWRLHAQFLAPKASAPGLMPVMVSLVSPAENRGETRGFLYKMSPPGGMVLLETRGVGDTAWGEELNWHLRRATVWTGRTIASMRVWDTLRGLHAVRQLPGVDPGRISLAARGEMCAVAAYAALLDGGVRTLVLQDPPATQDAGGAKDGRGPALEMIRCLRVTDLWQVAGLLWPGELVLSGTIPDTYSWAGELYKELGEPGRMQRVADIGKWKVS